MTVHEDLITVAMAATGNATKSFQRESFIAMPLNDVVARLRSAIEATDLWVLHEIDPQALLRKGGYAIPAARQILFFHPSLMVRLLAANVAAILEVPLKYALVEEPGGVRMRWFDPAAAFARYGNKELTELGEELGKICEGIANRAMANIKNIAA